MILLDTSVWVDHLRRTDHKVVAWLEARLIVTDPFVIGEIACGVPPRRAETLALLHQLPTGGMPSHAEVLGFIERHALAGRSLRYVDMHLLASAMMTPGASLWTRDRRMGEAAASLGIAHKEQDA